MNFVEKITTSIKNPKNAMKSIAEQPMIEEAVMIVGIYAIISVLAAYVQSSKITFVFEGFENMPSSMQSLTAVFSVIGALIGPFLIWLIGTGIIHVLSLALGGEGRFYPQMMTVIGYSFIPLLFAGLISLALLFMVEPMTITISATNPMATKEIYNNPFFFASTIIGTIMQIWAAVIIFFGVQSAHRLTPIKSAIVAGIPLLITVMLVVRSLSIL
jgi:hypothetical protein